MFRVWFEKKNNRIVWREEILMSRPALKRASHRMFGRGRKGKKRWARKRKVTGDQAKRHQARFTPAKGQPRKGGGIA